MLIATDVTTLPDDWHQLREELLGRRISELGLTLSGSPVEPLVNQLYRELEEKGLAFRPPVYLTDEWGCPEGTPRIGIPFYLADTRLARVEEEYAASVESRRDIIRFLRHEAGHAFNYAYQLHDREDWSSIFGAYHRSYRERYHADPFSRHYVRHVLGWYAQKHPDEDFAETFAVWLTPGSDWRQRYAGWPALRKLEYVDAAMRDVGARVPFVPEESEDDVPVWAMKYTLREHYRHLQERLPVEDPSFLDHDLQEIMPSDPPADVAPSIVGGPDGAEFIRQHRRELIRRIAHWTGEAPALVGELLDHLASRAVALGLRAASRESTLLIELTAFGTAVMMRHRYDRVLGRRRRERIAARARSMERGAGLTGVVADRRG